MSMKIASLCQETDNYPIPFSFALRVMHDEVSETENIRKNLAIESMIEEGCDILLDVNQMFVRQGKTSDYHAN